MEKCPQLLNTVTKEKELIVRKNKRNHGVLSEDKKLELRLGPPGEDQSLLNLGYSNEIHGAKRVLQETAAAKKEKKSSLHSPVVGWPPIRLFRKSLSNNNFSKPDTKSSPKEESVNFEHQMFVKINMDGVPIGRKVDLKAYESYEELSLAIDQLFRSLVADQRYYSAANNEEMVGGAKAAAGSLHGSGEYTLVYEDNEGDRMLVGDVPWHMFVSTVKRLRLLKSSELSTVRREIT